MEESEIFRYCNEDGCDVGKIEALLKNGEDPNTVDYDNGSTLLQYAIYFGYLECVKLLIRYGANPNIKNDFGFTPLQSATIHSATDNVECLIFLLDHGAYINIEGPRGITLLHCAAMDNNKECMKILLERGGMELIHVKNYEGNTFLDIINDEPLRKEMEEYIRELSTLDVKEPSS